MNDSIYFAESGRRIKELREAQGMTMEQLGNGLGVNKSTIKRYEDGSTKRITIATYEKLATILGTTVLYLMEGVSEKKEHTSFLKPMPQMYAIPILGVIKAGEPIIAQNEILGYTYIDNKNTENFFALKVKGDSMDLVNIKDGSVVVVKRQEYLENGDIGVALIDNEDATVKRVFINGDIATLIPQSSNPQNQPIIVNLKEQDFKILGKVIKAEYFF